MLAGLDEGNPFAVRLLDITNWKKEWVVKSITAIPLPDRGQSIVNMILEVEKKLTRARYQLPFHVEIRWSHGKFCGNPEGKLYKEFHWRDVPFYQVLF